MCIVCAVGTDDPDLVAEAVAGRSTRHAPVMRDDPRIEAGRAFVARHPTLDIHAHPGRFFMLGAARNAFTDHYPAPFPSEAVADMRAGGLSAALFATVADHAVLGFGARSLAARRDFRPDEAYTDHLRQLTVLDALIAREALRRAPDAAAVESAHRDGALGCMISVEGGDFIEDRLERVAEARVRGVRSITIIHYRTNQIGDTQTEAPVHGGLTPLGRDVVRAMERAGVVVDLSHADLATSRDVIDMASAPVILSHSNVAPPGEDHLRLVTTEHARLVAGTGGVVGAVPAGFAQASFDDYVDTVLRMVDLLGAGHVAIGTDMDFTFRSVLPSYLQWPLLPGALLARGLDEAETAMVMGGNMLRVLRAAERRETVADDAA